MPSEAALEAAGKWPNAPLAMNHVFPSKVTAHVTTFANGHSRNVLVSPSETFGKALVRMGYSPDDVKSVALINAPLDYEPDYSIASR